MDKDPTNCNKSISLLLGILLLGTNTFFINFSFSPFERSFGKRKEKKVLTSFLFLPFPDKLSASFWIVQSKLLDVFPEQLKELTETEITVLLEDVGKVEVLSLTQSELRNTVEEVD